MFLRASVCVSILFLTSCGGGPQLTKVSGNVKYKGKAIANATVIFEPDGGVGTVGAATTDSSGNYNLGSNLGTGVPAGAYSVKIKSKVKLVDETDPMAGLTPGSKEYEQAYMKASTRSSADAYKTKKDPDSIPEKYDTGSELKQIVEAKSSQVIDFDLK
jgi:hypothetical protein